MDGFFQPLAFTLSFSQSQFDLVPYPPPSCFEFFWIFQVARYLLPLSLRRLRWAGHGFAANPPRFLKFFRDIPHFKRVQSSPGRAYKEFPHPLRFPLFLSLIFPTRPKQVWKLQAQVLNPRRRPRAPPLLYRPFPPVFLHTDLVQPPF